MKINNNNLENSIQVIENQTYTWKVIEAIANQQEDAFYVCDLSDIVWKHKNWKNLMPRIAPHYAVKCNPTHVVVETLKALGCGFDCASEEEIHQVLSMNVDPDLIIFANPTKPISHINYAKSVGVAKMTFDNEPELYKIKKFYPDAEMVIRIRYDDPDAGFSLGSKFGCDPEDEAPILLNLAQDLGINVIGVSFHIGSDCNTPSIFLEAIKAASKIFKLAPNYGFNFNLLDIGGGYHGERNNNIKEIAKFVNKALDEYFPDPSVRVISEPGQYYVKSAFTIAANIHSMKILNKNKTDRQYMYYVNVGVYNSFISKFFDTEYIPVPLKKTNGVNTTYLSTIWGPTCDSEDKISENVLLPEMNLGDWLIFENLGSYSISISSKFNGFPIPKVYFVVDKSTWSLLKNAKPFTKERFQFTKWASDLNDAYIIPKQ